MKMDEVRKQLNEGPAKILEDRNDFIAAEITMNGEKMRVNFVEENGKVIRHVC